MNKSRIYSDAPSVDVLDINRSGRRMFSLGIVLTIFSTCALCVALYIVWYEKTHEERTTVLMEVDMVHGTIRPLQEFEGTLPPEWRMRLIDSVLVQLVGDLESFDRGTVNVNLTRASNFMARNVLKPFVERARERADTFLPGDVVEVQVHNISPITGFEMDDTQKPHQSLIDFELTERRNGMETKTLYTATVTFRFPGYIREQLQSLDPDQVRQIRANPLGVQIEGYVRKQSTLAPATPAVSIRERKL